MSVVCDQGQTENLSATDLHSHLFNSTQIEDTGQVWSPRQI